MAPTITGISSMATRLVLAELVARYWVATGRTVSIEAMGGVDAAKRVRAGEVFDLVILADDVTEKLETEGHLIAGSRAGFVRSPMAMAVRTGDPRPDIADPASVTVSWTVTNNGTAALPSASTRLSSYLVALLVRCGGVDWHAGLRVNSLIYRVQYAFLRIIE